MSEIREGEENIREINKLKNNYIIYIYKYQLQIKKKAFSLDDKFFKTKRQKVDPRGFYRNGICTWYTSFRRHCSQFSAFYR